MARKYVFLQQKNKHLGIFLSKLEGSWKRKNFEMIK
jgi:hypothetical protein